MIMDKLFVENTYQSADGLGSITRLSVSYMTVFYFHRLAYGCVKVGSAEVSFASSNRTHCNSSS